jgi:hypothetical protein
VPSPAILKISHSNLIVAQYDPAGQTLQRDILAVANLMTADPLKHRLEDVRRGDEPHKRYQIAAKDARSNGLPKVSAVIPISCAAQTN